MDNNTLKGDGMRPHKPKVINDQGVIEMFTVRQLPTREIARQLGVPQSRIYRILRDANVDMSGRLEVPCALCGAPVSVYRCRLRVATEQGRRVFCGAECHADYRAALPDGYQWHHPGRKRALELLGARDGQDVWFRNGNPYDHKPGNLVLVRTRDELIRLIRRGGESK